MFENDYNYMLIYTYIFYVKKYYNSSTIKISGKQDPNYIIYIRFQIIPVITM